MEGCSASMLGALVLTLAMAVGAVLLEVDLG